MLLRDGSRLTGGAAVEDAERERWIESKRDVLGLLALHESGDDEALVRANRDLLTSKRGWGYEDSVERMVLQLVAVASSLLNELAEAKGICGACLASQMALDAAVRD